MKLYCADCMDILKEIPGGSIDMILCDLPYGTTRNKWDTIIPLEPLWVQYRRIIKSDGIGMRKGKRMKNKRDTLHSLNDKLKKKK